MEIKRINTSDARAALEKYIAEEKIDCPVIYQNLRNDILTCFSKTLTQLKIRPENISKGNNAYMVDVVFGLAFYELMNKKYNLTFRDASDRAMWRYLSCVVVPDIVRIRYGINHPDRFYAKPKRIWMRVLWWYMHLSWQGSINETYKVIINNSTDEILQLVDRCGKGGYRVSLYREIMKQYSSLDIVLRRRKQIFRKMMVLNTARSQAVEPSLTEGGDAGYVRRLIRDVNR